MALLNAVVARLRRVIERTANPEATVAELELIEARRRSAARLASILPASRAGSASGIDEDAGPPVGGSDSPAASQSRALIVVSEQSGGGPRSSRT